MDISIELTPEQEVARQARIDAEKPIEWEAPKTFEVSTDRVSYPIDALPCVLREAIEEVHGFIKAPIPLVASSALSVASLVTQAHADVRRAERLQGPSGLFMLTIADSGERKTTCDSLFMTSIREYEAEQEKIAEPFIREHDAAMDAWEAKKGGIKEKIRQLAKEGKDTSKFEDSLNSLLKQKPEPPRVPRLIYGDATPEALGFCLAKNWPSGGIVSSEAGVVFGSHGMGKDSVMRNLAQLNVLWDGGALTIDRRTSDSFTVRGARLTVGLQIQEPTLRDFFQKSGVLARGTGFLARFLLAWPESTQGSRMFSEPPSVLPSLAAFHRRIEVLLHRPMPINDRGELVPPILGLSVEAKRLWIEYHDSVEAELMSGGELYDVRDVASKSADNAARLAAIFQRLEGDSPEISPENLSRASRIALWHLSEARRFFGEMAVPQVFSDAIRLDSWILEECRKSQLKSVSARDAQRLGPIREHGRLQDAIGVLDELSRARLVKNGKRKLIEINPELLRVQ